MSEDMDLPDGAEIADGADQTEALQAENAGLKEQVLRYAAEAENIRRRAERETNDARAYAIQKFARDLLGVADNLSRALAAHPTVETADPAMKNFIVGVEMTEKELTAAFERNGLKKIQPAKGEKFDPHLHQAMMELAAADVTPGAIVEVMQSGYELLGRLVRPAMVVVAAKGAGAGQPAGGDGSSTANAYAASEDDGSGDAADTRA
jgi:molecular chaperone GrpE